MPLTIGTSPFGPSPAGTFTWPVERPEHPMYVEDSLRHVRVCLGEETVANSTDVRMLHPPSQTPVYLFPRSDVRTDLFSPSDTTAEAPGLGTATFWTVTAGDRTARDAAYAYEAPPSGAAAAAGLVAFVWDAMDSWFEEDEEVFVHPRDPYTRIDVLRTSRHVVVRWGGTVVADTTDARMLLETGLPPRWYLPREDVRTDLLEPSFTTTRCPYKGVAHYRTLRDGDRTTPDAVWTYPEPMHDALAVGGLLCFVSEHVDIDVRLAR